MKVTTSTDRRAAIGDAAIRIVAREGLRALTHRAIDRELTLPPGSTSYYARTRQQLIELVVHRLANRTTADMGTAPNQIHRAAADRESGGGPDEVTETARDLAGLLDRLAERPDDHRARFALAVDLVTEPELHGLLTRASPIRPAFLAAAGATLDRLGVPDPQRNAPDLVALLDGLLFDRVAGAGADPASRPDAARMITAYLRGLIGG